MDASCYQVFQVANRGLELTAVFEVNLSVRSFMGQVSEVLVRDPLLVLSSFIYRL